MEQFVEAVARNDSTIDPMNIPYRRKTLRLNKTISNHLKSKKRNVILNLFQDLIPFFEPLARASNHQSLKSSNP